MSFLVEIGLFLLVCWAALVLEISQDGISTLSYFSQNIEKTGNFLLINLQNNNYTLV